MITRIIDRNFANMRLDRFLRKAFPDESLSVFFAVIRKKKVRVNGVVGKANQMLAEGDTVCIYENFKSVSEEEKAGAPVQASNIIALDSGFAKNKSTWGKATSPADPDSFRFAGIPTERDPWDFITNPDFPDAPKGDIRHG